MSKKDSTSALVKEWWLLIGGSAGIAYQLITDNVNLFLLIVFTAMTGIQGGYKTVSLLRDSSAIARSLSSRLGSSESDLGKSSDELSSEDNR